MLLLLVACCISCSQTEIVDDDMPEMGTGGKIEAMSSPFDKRLMDLTGYLIENDSLLKIGETRGLNYSDLIYNQGHIYANNREYIVVRFRYKGDSIYRTLVAHQKEEGFSAFIRESSTIPFVKTNAPKSKVFYKSLWGVSLRIEEYEYGKMVNVKTNTELKEDFQ